VAGEYAHLRRRARRRAGDHAFAVHARGPKFFEQLAPGRVLPDHADERRARPERGEVQSAVGRPARHGLRPLVPQNHHGGLARHAAYLPRHELVGYQVAQHDHAPPREPAHEPRQPAVQICLRVIHPNGQ
jgi:hypothetical protein